MATDAELKVWAEALSPKRIEEMQHDLKSQSTIQSDREEGRSLEGVSGDGTLRPSVTSRPTRYHTDDSHVWQVGVTFAACIALLVFVVWFVRRIRLQQALANLAWICHVSGFSILVAVFLIRLSVVGIDDLFERNGAPAFMLLLMAVPCASLAWMKPLTMQFVNAQRRYALVMLHFAAVVAWFVAFGGNWIEQSPVRHGIDDDGITGWHGRISWESNYVWTLVLIAPAIAWYFWFGWRQNDGHNDRAPAVK